ARVFKRPFPGGSDRRAAEKPSPKAPTKNRLGSQNKGRFDISATCPQTIGSQIGINLTRVMNISGIKPLRRLGRRCSGGRLPSRESSNCQPKGLPDAPEQRLKEPGQRRERQKVGEEDPDGPIEPKLLGNPSDGRADQRWMGENDIEYGQVAHRADGRSANVTKDSGRIYRDDAGRGPADDDF